MVMHTKIMAAWDEKKKKFNKAAVNTKVSSAEKKDLSGEPEDIRRSWLVKHAIYLLYFSTVPPPVLLSLCSSFPLGMYVI